MTKEEFDAAVFANDGMVPAEWIGNAGIGGSVVITPDSGGVRGYTPSGAMIDEAGNVSYRISQGDNLSTIAQGIGSSVEELAAYNNIDDPNIIIAGDVIRKPPAGFKINRSSQVAMHSDFELVEQQTVTINNAVSDARQSPEKLDFQSVTATGESINDRLVRMGGVSANVTGVHRGIYGSYRAGFFKSLAGEVGLGGFFDDIQDQADIEAYRETLVPGTTIKTGDVFDYSLRTAEVLSVVKALPSLAKSIRNWGSVVPDSNRLTISVDRYYNGGLPAIDGSPYSPSAINARSVEFYDFYGDGNQMRGAWDNLEVRTWYKAEDKLLPSYIDRSLPLERQAKQGFDMRNINRDRARELMYDRAGADRLYREEPNREWNSFIRYKESDGLQGDDVYRSILKTMTKSREEINKLYSLD
ncbi:MAG: LysM domain-containing protein [Sedimenticola sp.]